MKDNSFIISIILAILIAIPMLPNGIFAYIGTIWLLTIIFFIVGQVITYVQNIQNSD